MFSINFIFYAVNKRWRDDGKCGDGYLLDDGLPSICDPDGEYPCCNLDHMGECGNTTEHCSCKDCTDYRFVRDWWKSGGTQKWRSDKKCGSYFKLPDGSSNHLVSVIRRGCTHVVIIMMMEPAEAQATAKHCACSHCTDYKRIYREWRESGSREKWRYDRRCGGQFPLPDGTASQCNLDGEKPCCNRNGYCGNTTEDCTCYDCTDYSRIHREWKELGGTQKWRYDGRCGIKFPLPDGTPAECNPEGKHPYCSARDGHCTDSNYCNDLNCVDYRIVKKMRASGRNCTVLRMGSGFLKNVCFDEVTKTHSFRCTHSDDQYTHHEHVHLNAVSDKVSKVCEKDPSAYQACGVVGNDPINTNVLCGSYFCEAEDETGRHPFITLECLGIDANDCRAVGDRSSCSAKSSHKILCDDKCNDNYCEDESFCNGYRYGVVCNSTREEVLTVPVFLMCDRDPVCDNGLDEKDCVITEKTVHSCTRYGKDVTVPILNNMRCSVFELDDDVEPYCFEYLDQTNCSDKERIGGYCKINNYNSSVSKYVLCQAYGLETKIPIKLCDDDFQNNCVKFPDTGCEVHKHKMCDRVQDCRNGEDENNDMCALMTGEIDFKCTRRFQLRLNDHEIPMSWIMDDERDCLHGEDEDEYSSKWISCPGEVRHFTHPNKSCENFFKCSKDDKTFVRFNELCDGVESCSDSQIENEVCRIARDFPLSK